MKIPDAEIDRIKEEISIVRLVEARGVKLTGHGDNLIGLCPLHDDKNPSLVVSPQKNLWHCLGKCQTGGSVIDWVMKSNRVSFRLAVEMLRQQAPSLAAKEPPSSYKNKLEEILEPEASDDAVLLRVVNFYHRTLKETAEPQLYLEQRGLKSAEMVDHFRLGYANRTLGYRLPKKRIKAGEALRAQLQRLGIFRDSGHEHFTGSLVIPILGEDGAVREMYGRKVRDDLRTGTPLHLYLPARPDGRRGVFNLEALRASKEVILCEALIDALTFWCAGHRNVTTAYGVEGFTDELRSALVEHGTTKLLIAYDRDEAGDRAAEKLASELGHAGLEVFRVLFPKGMDANAFGQRVQPATKAFDTALRAATWMAGTRPVIVPDDLAEAAFDPITGEVFELDVSTATESRATDGTTQGVAEAAGACSSSEPPALLAADSPLAEVPAGEPAATQLTAPAPAAKLEAEVREEEIRIRLGDRRWRIRGLAKLTSYESLRVNVLVSRGDAFFVDTLELYSARQRATFLKEASDELKMQELVLKSDLGRIVLRLEDLVHQQIEETLAVEKSIEISEEEKEEAMRLLRDPRLLERILEDFDKAGVVGEETNKLVGYLAAVSRKLETPLAIVIQSSSAAGKSSLMDAVLRFMPEEERIQYSAMTGQSLFYMGETNLSHKILAIAEEEGAESASYALKLLQSEGELAIASTGKDPATGKLVTHEYRVKGPVMLFLTTTAIEVDEELLNRCLVLTVDEGSKQTSAIHERQRHMETLEGLLARNDRDNLVKLHQNAQRLIAPLAVVNPLAKSLHFSSQATRTRRDHMKYLCLIKSIALLHQHQRPIKDVEHRGRRIRYVEVTATDVETADRLSGVVLGHCLDELPPQTRRLLEELERLVAARAEALGIEKSAVRFTRREIREATKLGHTQLRVHLARLEDLEYLLVHAGGGRRRFVYELTYSYDPNLAGGTGHLAGSWRAIGGGAPRQDSPGVSLKNGDLGGGLDKEQIRPATKIRSYAQTVAGAQG